MLIADRTALKEEQQRIKVELAEAQDQIDHIVVQTKIVIGSAGYAIGHTKGVALTRDDLSTVNRIANTLPEAERQLVRKLTQFYDIATYVSDAALDQFSKYRERLSKLPISPWAHDVFWNIEQYNGEMIEGGWHPNGTPYQPGVTPQDMDADDTQADR